MEIFFVVVETIKIVIAMATAYIQIISSRQCNNNNNGNVRSVMSVKDEEEGGRNGNMRRWWPSY